MICADDSKGDMKMYTPEKNLIPNAVNCILHKKLKLKLNSEKGILNLSYPSYTRQRQTYYDVI